ncbi:MAG: branched chain amino acid ABC transporter substrate-binding protein [Candidatus Muproteobacteria bacterium RBG_16_62_13]|uniref:Branched chain amino acid ABC transporter substrate-binding protein n=1 Tax=Candidatus Muproteobacteria bacterium RBG_16_62_13 TaxID=1817756 RepID=A0A1F6T250_9PROT|nr:MAG: branched chain amino acid ABC transporter substrate-binding protein [Candidatus Muproteobacteria bacterium RBG_16_62_13]
MNFFRLVTVLGLAGLLLAGCGKREAPRTASGELIIRIGSVAPLTGPQAHLGKDNDNGARLAIDEINARGVTLGGKRVHFEIMSEDDQADPRNARIVAQKLVDARVVAVLGHLNSGTSIPASKIYHDHGIVQITPSATAVAYTEQGYKTAFRVMTNDRQQGKVLGEFTVKRLGKRVAIIDDRTAYGQGLADEVVKAIESSGGTVVAREYTNDRSTDFLAILTSIKAKNPDVIFFGGMDAQSGPMARQMQQLGIKARFLGGDGTQSTEFLKLAGPAADGVTASSPGLPLVKMPGGSEFERKFTARYGRIQNYSPYAYDAAHVLVAAMIKADSADPAKFLPVLRTIALTGATGRIAFDERGDVRGGVITLYRARNGKWEVLETVTSAAPGTRK